MEERAAKKQGFFKRIGAGVSDFIERSFPIEDEFYYEPGTEELEPEILPPPSQTSNTEKEPVRKKEKNKKHFRNETRHETIHENNVLPFPTNNETSGVFEIKALQITNINQIRDTIAILKSGTPCIVNITEELDNDDASGEGIFPNITESQRAIDLLSGASLALDGYIEEFVPGKRVYIVAPANVKISKELREEVIRSGIFGRSAAAGRR